MIRNILLLNVLFAIACFSRESLDFPAISAGDSDELYEFKYRVYASPFRLSEFLASTTVVRNELPNWYEGLRAELRPDTFSDRDQLFDYLFVAESKERLGITKDRLDDLLADYQPATDIPDKYKNLTVFGELLVEDAESDDKYCIVLLFYSGSLGSLPINQRDEEALGEDGRAIGFLQKVFKFDRDLGVYLSFDFRNKMGGGFLDKLAPLSSVKAIIDFYENYSEVDLSGEVLKSLRQTGLERFSDEESVVLSVLIDLLQDEGF